MQHKGEKKNINSVLCSCSWLTRSFQPQRLGQKDESWPTIYFCHSDSSSFYVCTLSCKHLRISFSLERQKTWQIISSLTQRERRKLLIWSRYGSKIPLKIECSLCKEVTDSTDGMQRKVERKEREEQEKVKRNKKGEEQQEGTKGKKRQASSQIGLSNQASYWKEAMRMYVCVQYSV